MFKVVTLHVSVWVEILFQKENTIVLVVTLHVSVWVEIKLSAGYFKCPESHAPRERVSWNSYNTDTNTEKWRSRSTWACELKFNEVYFTFCMSVTLHVSVWVEIYNGFCLRGRIFVTLHVSVWVEIVNKPQPYLQTLVTLHVSVWVEMIDAVISLPENMVTLHVSVWVEIKSFEYIDRDESHAPRERVSWNYMLLRHSFRHTVTLHVSVWVEILSFLFYVRFLLSRSTWACELKFHKSITNSPYLPSRSTWACELKCTCFLVIRTSCKVTLHVSVWVEMTMPWSVVVTISVTLHVSVWVEMVS